MSLILAAYEALVNHEISEADRAAGWSSVLEAEAGQYFFDTFGMKPDFVEVEVPDLKGIAYTAFVTRDDITLWYTNESNQWRFGEDYKLDPDNYLLSLAKALDIEGAFTAVELAAEVQQAVLASAE